MVMPLTAASPAPPADPAPKNVKEAAQQFEALMIAQMLRSAKEAGGEETEDSTGATMLDLAHQQFAKVLAANGGLGLAKIIVRGVEHR